MLYLSKIIKKSTDGVGVIDMTIACPQIAQTAKPGQFINIKCGQERILRRPISICDSDGENIRFLFQIRGGGTEWLSEREIGDTLDIHAPLGKGFTIGDTNKTAVFVGGGIGVFPLLYASRMYAQNAVVLLGFRSSEHIALVGDFKSNGAEVQIATDDGSAGRHGYVTDLLADYIKNTKNIENIDCIFACGPLPMLERTANIANSNNIKCEVSMEERMACGVGACLVCACETKHGYKHICKDGPVFDSTEIF